MLPSWLSKVVVVGSKSSVLSSSSHSWFKPRRMNLSAFHAVAAHGLVRSFLLLEESVHVLDQAVEALFYDTPDNPIIDSVISVNENVAKGNDVAVITELQQELGFVALDPIDCL